MAAEMGARAQSAVDTASGDGVFETYELGKTIVASSKLYANQRRSNRLLPGGSDSTTAACYMIGGTPDSVLSPLVSRVNPCDPREERCKAVERVLKDKTRGAICALNGENPREARADNLAAVRICEVVADVLVAYSSRRMMESRKELYSMVSKQDVTIKELEDQLEREKRKRLEIENECWCKGQNDNGNANNTSNNANNNNNSHNNANINANINHNASNSNNTVNSNNVNNANSNSNSGNTHQFERDKVVLGGRNSNMNEQQQQAGDKADNQ